MNFSAATSPPATPAAAWPRWTRATSPTWSSRRRSAPISIEYREPSVDGRPGKLLGACLSDQQSDGLSMIYSFFDAGPDARKGLGTFIILDHIVRAGARGPALRLSRLLGRGLEADGLQDQLPPARAARAATAGGGWTSRNGRGPRDRPARPPHPEPPANRSLDVIRSSRRPTPREGGGRRPPLLSTGRRRPCARAGRRSCRA